jgi:hypothetical protein
MRAKLNLEKRYQNDNYLIQTLKRTKRVTNENPVDKFEQNLQSLLNKIYKEIQLLNDPIIKQINKENHIFQSDYNLLLERFQNNTLLIFQDLINLYKSKGYKIPSLDCSHNLFKVNPLLEENTNKIIHYFLLQRTLKTKKEMLLIKSVVFLRKLIKLLGKNSKNKKKNEKDNFIVATDNKTTDKNSEIENLKKNIQKIMKLIENCKIEEEKESKNKKCYSKVNTLKITGKSSKLLSKINIISPNKRRRKSVISTLDKKDDMILKTSRILNFDDQTTNDDKKIIFKNQEKTVNFREIKRREKTLNTYHYKKNDTDSMKINNMEINNKFSKSEKKIEKKKDLYNKTFENFNKKLKINLFTKKFSKPFSHIRNLTKIEKRNKRSIPLFVRTQTNESHNTVKVLIKKKSSFNKSRNHFNTSGFTNKTEFFNFIYRRLKKGNFHDVDKYVKKYLNEIECKSSEEISQTFSRYDYKNFKSNINELENYIKKSDLERKTEKIYLNNFISKRVISSLMNMREKESQISKLNRLIATIGNVTK